MRRKYNGPISRRREHGQQHEAGTVPVLNTTNSNRKWFRRRSIGSNSASRTSSFKYAGAKLGQHASYAHAQRAVQNLLRKFSIPNNIPRRSSKTPSVPKLSSKTTMVSPHGPLDNSDNTKHPCSEAPRGTMPTVPHDTEHPKDDAILDFPPAIEGPISIATHPQTEATQEAPIAPSDKPSASPLLLPPGPGPGISSNDAEFPIAILVPAVPEPNILTSSNPDWTRIKRLRSEIWSQRSRVQEMRGSLRDKQDRKATADDEYIQYVRLRGHGVRFGNRTSSDEQTEIDVLFNACVTAREEYGPFEDALNALETNLSVNEFELDRLERKFYDQPFKPQAPLIINPENKDISSISPSVASTDSESESGQQFHPLVIQYLSKLGDVDLLREKLDELLEERYTLEEEREKRARVKMKLSDENEEWLANYSDVESGLIEEYENATREMEKLKKECIDKGWVDMTGEPLSLEHLERQTFADDLDGDGGREPSEYVKFPKLIPQPGNKVTNTLPESLLDVNEPAFMSSVRVNRWILDQLRTSPMEVGLLARTFESRYGPINKSDKWQSDVLQLWYRDGAQDGWLAGRASSVVITMAPRDTGYSTSTSSLETQIPPWDPAGELSRSQIFPSEDDSVYSIDDPSARRARRPIPLVKGKGVENSKPSKR